MSDTFDRETNELMNWAWSDGIAAVDAKDSEYTEASAHVEMFLVLGEVLNMLGWSRDELIELMDDVVFADGTPPMVH